MALTAKSQFLYGYQVNSANSAIDFRTVSGGPVLQATLRYGYYSLTTLLVEVARAMSAVDPVNRFLVTADRTIMAGAQNRVTIATNSSVYLDLLFASGPRALTSCATLLGFANTDQTGAITYTGTQTTGLSFRPTLIGYSYLGPEYQQKQFGSVNVSASGVKEAIVFQTQRFVRVTFKYEPASAILANWTPFMQWATKQRLFEFVPEVTNPSVFYDVTIEKTTADGKGLAYTFNEMLPDFPNLYDIGSIMMRINEV